MATPLTRLRLARQKKIERDKGWFPSDVKDAVYKPGHDVYLIHVTQDDKVIDHYVGFSTRGSLDRFKEHSGGRAGGSPVLERYQAQGAVIELIHTWQGHSIGFEKAMHILRGRNGYYPCHVCLGRQYAFRADEVMKCMDSDDLLEIRRAKTEWVVQMRKMHK